MMMTFVDLCAGIGGFHLALDAVGGECVYACERDKHAAKTYRANFFTDPTGDLFTTPSEDVPHHDILTAGFPCQPFSQAARAKLATLGRATGFDDGKRGTVFFEIARIIGDKRPAAFLLENVPAITSHDGGRTFETILDVLGKHLGYHIWHDIIDSSYAVPQARKRLFIVGFRDPTLFWWPEQIPTHGVLRDVLEPDPDPKLTLSEKAMEGQRRHRAKQEARGHGFGYCIADLDKPSKTFVAHYHKHGTEILIPQEGRNPRRLSPREAARLMGFPDSFEIPVSNTQAWKQFGNAVVVPVAQDIAAAMVETIDSGRMESDAQAAHTFDGVI
jgi:DNA (cytosine-5)-methyltransferase 1